MNRDKRIDLDLIGYGTPFHTGEERMEAAKPKVEDIPLTELHPFRNHPFCVSEDEELERLKESIRTSGVLVPALVRPLKEGGYELISGHRRMAACKALGMETLPVIVRELTDEEAVISMVDANLQREHIKPSEKAFAYKMKMEAMAHQGKHTSDQVGPRLTAEEISRDDSASQVKRYIRLTNLIPEILKLVDDGKIALTPAVELSFLNEIEQQDLLASMVNFEATPSLSQAVRLHRISRERGLTDEDIEGIMEEEKANQKEYLKIPLQDLRGFFSPGTSYQRMTETIVKAMNSFRKQQERERQRDER